MMRFTRQVYTKHYFLVFTPTPIGRALGETEHEFPCDALGNVAEELQSAEFFACTLGERPVERGVVDLRLTSELEVIGVWCRGIIFVSTHLPINRCECCGALYNRDGERMFPVSNLSLGAMEEN